MKNIVKSTLLLVLLMVILAACGGEDPTGIGGDELTGKWLDENSALAMKFENGTLSEGVKYDDGTFGWSEHFIAEYEIVESDGLKYFEFINPEGELVSWEFSIVGDELIVDFGTFQRQ